MKKMLHVTTPVNATHVCICSISVCHIRHNPQLGGCADRSRSPASFSWVPCGDQDLTQKRAPVSKRAQAYKKYDQSGGAQNEHLSKSAHACERYDRLSSSCKNACGSGTCTRTVRMSYLSSIPVLTHTYVRFTLLRRRRITTMSFQLNREKLTKLAQNELDSHNTHYKGRKQRAKSNDALGGVVCKKRKRELDEYQRALREYDNAIRLAAKASQVVCQKAKNLANTFPGGAVDRIGGPLPDATLPAWIDA